MPAPTSIELALRGASSGPGARSSPAPGPRRSLRPPRAESARRRRSDTMRRPEHDRMQPRASTLRSPRSSRSISTRATPRASRRPASACCRSRARSRSVSAARCGCACGSCRSPWAQTWLVRVVRLEEPTLIVDEMLRGPFPAWLHEHRFARAARRAHAADRSRHVPAARRGARAGRECPGRAPSPARDVPQPAGPHEGRDRGRGKQEHTTCELLALSAATR